MKKADFPYVKESSALFYWSRGRNESKLATFFMSKVYSPRKLICSVIGRKNWLFSVSEAGAKANAICLSLTETTKANGIDFYQYLVKLITDLTNLPFHQQPEILHNYMPWSENI